MAVYVSNIVIEQGYDFETSFQLADTRTNSSLDLRNTSTQAKLRKHYSSTSAVSFAASVTNPIQGQITIELDASQTNDLKPGRYVYDIKIITLNGSEYKAVEGAALVRAGVTR
jgi:hypothetical protein